MKTLKLKYQYFIILLMTIWCILAFRFDAILISFAFSLALLVPHLRKNSFVFGTFVLILALYPLQPISITLMNFPGAPKLLRHCQNVGAEGIAAAYVAQKNGECIVASDISGFFEPTIYVVW